MGHRELIINYTRREIVRIDNDGHHTILDQIKIAIHERETWSIDDDIGSFLYDFDNKSIILNLLAHGFKCERLDWFDR